MELVVNLTPHGTTLLRVFELLLFLPAMWILYQFARPLPFPIVDTCPPPESAATVKDVDAEVILPKVQVEDLAFRELEAFGGTPDGRVLRFFGPNLAKTEQIAQRSTWLLSGAFSPTDGRLYFADPFVGLLSANVSGNQWLDERIHVHLNFANQCSVAPDGKVYCSDSHDLNDARFTRMENFGHSLFAGKPSGRVIVFDPKTSQSKTLIGGLFGANGIAISPDNRFAFVGDMMAGTIHKIDLSSGQVERNWATGLGGYLDNMYADKDGLFVAVVVLKNTITDLIFHNKIARHLITRLPPQKFGAHPGGLIYVPYQKNRAPKKLIRVTNMPAVNSIHPRPDGWVYTSSYMMEGAVGRIRLDEFQNK